jgi:hypothetical protein
MNVDELVKLPREDVESGYGEEKWKFLVGKRIEEVAVSACGTWLALRLTDGPTVLCYTEADCCSSSWIEHINGEELFPATIQGVEETDVDARQDPEHDYLQVYETVFVTDKGRFTVEYRNASNGFYGGSLEVVGVVAP